MFAAMNNSVDAIKALEGADIDLQNQVHPWGDRLGFDSSFMPCEGG